MYFNSASLQQLALSLVATLVTTALLVSAAVGPASLVI